jgi:hypothetical protein
MKGVRRPSGGCRGGDGGRSPRGLSVPPEGVTVASAEGATVAPTEGAMVAPTEGTTVAPTEGVIGSSSRRGDGRIRRRGCRFRPKRWRSRPLSRVTPDGAAGRPPQDRGHRHREGHRRGNRCQAGVVDAQGGLTSGSGAKQAGVQHRRGETSGLVPSVRFGLVTCPTRGRPPLHPAQTPQVTSSGHVVHRFQESLSSRIAAWWNGCIRTSVLGSDGEAP